MSGRSSQRKGREGELELCRIFRAHSISAEPGTPLNYGQEPDIKGVPGIHCEVKRAETLRLSEWMTQSENDAQRFHDGAPTLFFRRSREQWRVIMNLSDWMMIYLASQRHNAAEIGENRKEGGQ